ncbi:MAG: hypothetical protein V4558_01430 [Gemmatimonadota bacterium]
MSSLIAFAVLAAFLVWFLGLGKGRPVAAPEDDVVTPVDEDELEAAEREVREAGARPINEALADEEGHDDDDWGPGTSRSNLPGIV